jgi:type IV secretory pathway protease TraF
MRMASGTAKTLDDGARCGWRAPVPHVAFGERTLRPGEVQLAGDRRSQSWDGRYFGPTSRVLGRTVRFIALGG